MRNLPLIVTLLISAACARPGGEDLSRFNDPKGQFSALFPAGWPMDGNFDQASPSTPIRWVEATSRVEAVDEGLKLGVSFKVARFPLDRADFQGDDDAYARFKKAVLDLKTAPFAGKPAGDATVAGLPSVSKTGEFVHANPIHGVGPVPMKGRTVLIRAPKAVYQVELIAVTKQFDAYAPLFEKSLAGFSVLER